MKLLYTPNSPYARRARVAIEEAGLTGTVETVNIDPREKNLDQLLAHNPSGKVPLLVTDGGRGICESLIIADELDRACGGRLYPTDPGAREQAREVESVASALMDSLFVRSHENRRAEAERSAAVTAHEHGRTNRCYDALEQMAPSFGDTVDMATITVACALGYADGRHPDDGWREGRPALSGWYEAFIERPSLATTMPRF